MPKDNELLIGRLQTFVVYQKLSKNFSKDRIVVAAQLENGRDVVTLTYDTANLPKFLEKQGALTEEKHPLRNTPLKKILKLLTEQGQAEESGKQAIITDTKLGHERVKNALEHIRENFSRILSIMPKKISGAISPVHIVNAANISNEISNRSRPQTIDKMLRYKLGNKGMMYESSEPIKIAYSSNGNLIARMRELLTATALGLNPHTVIEKSKIMQAAMEAAEKHGRTIKPTITIGEALAEAEEVIRMSSKERQKQASKTKSK